MFVEYFSPMQPHSCPYRNQSTTHNNPLRQTLTLLDRAVGRFKKKLPYTFILSGCLCVLFCLSMASPADSAQVTLAWDPNTEADLAGYCVYFNSGTPGPPFNLFGCINLNELNDPNNPKYRLGGIKPGYYCFAVTAFDTEGNESDFSRAACAEIRQRAMTGPMLLLQDE